MATVQCEYRISSQPDGRDWSRTLRQDPHDYQSGAGHCSHGWSRSHCDPVDLRVSSDGGLNMRLERRRSRGFESPVQVILILVRRVLWWTTTIQIGVEPPQVIPYEIPGLLCEYSAQSMGTVFPGLSAQNHKTKGGIRMPHWYWLEIELSGSALRGLRCPVHKAQ
jgi:hypothetical protein